MSLSQKNEVAVQRSGHKHTAGYPTSVRTLTSEARTSTFPLSYLWSWKVQAVEPSSVQVGDQPPRHSGKGLVVDAAFLVDSGQS